MRRSLREISYAFFIGSLRFFACTSAEEVNNLVNALLATPTLMKYYMCLFIAFGMVSLFAWITSYRSIRKIHRFLINVGGGLLAAFRAALEALIGYVLVALYRDPFGVGAGSIVSIMLYATLVLPVCICLAWLDEVFRNPHGVKCYD
jgi:uncharacterized membrane protein